MPLDNDQSLYIMPKLWLFDIMMRPDIIEIEDMIFMIRILMPPKIVFIM